MGWTEGGYGRIRPGQGGSSGAGDGGEGGVAALWSYRTPILEAYPISSDLESRAVQEARKEMLKEAPVVVALAGPEAEGTGVAKAGRRR